MIRVRIFDPVPGNDRALLRECGCCGLRYAVKRRGMRLFAGEGFDSEICPECVLLGPRGAAAKIRARIAAMGGEGGAERGREEGQSWARLMRRRARRLEATPSFPLAARQAAVRETRERR